MLFDRSHTFDKVPVIACGDTNGVLRLYLYPCMSTASAEKNYVAHSEAVRCVRFTYDDGYLISVGGSDRAICVWKTDCIEEARELEAAGYEIGQTGGYNTEEDDEILGDEDANEEESLFFEKDESRGGGDQFLSIDHCFYLSDSMRLYDYFSYRK